MARPSKGDRLDVSPYISSSDYAALAACAAQAGQTVNDYLLALCRRELASTSARALPYMPAGDGPHKQAHVRLPRAEHTQFAARAREVHGMSAGMLLRSLVLSHLAEEGEDAGVLPLARQEVLDLL